MAKKIYRIVSWGLIVLSVLFFVLALRKPSLVPVATSSQAARSFDAKLAQLARPHPSGAPGQIRITESELNSKLQENLQKPPPASGGSLSLEQATIHLGDGAFVGTFKMNVRGVDVYLTLGGILRSQNGQLQFIPQVMKVGSLPIPIFAVKSMLRASMGSPEMRRRMQLPESIKDLHTENGEVVVLHD
jgi:uncharacterized protein YpmS